MKLSGTCLCGGVGFRLDGWVSPVQACHADRCRKATGALFSPEIAASAEGFEWTGDPELIAIYEAPILHDPPAYRRAFCRTCGSPLPVILREAGIVVLHAGLLDDTTDLHVFRHAFTAQKTACCEITDSAPQYEGQPPAPDPADLLA